MVRSCALLLALSAAIPTSLAAQAVKPGTARPVPKKPAAPPAPPKAVAKAPEPPKRVPPDVRITTAYVTGEVESTSTVSMKGARSRISLGADLASIQQCDIGQTLQVNSQTRTYLATPAAAEPAPAANEKSKKGGQIVFTTTVTDTGEKESILGFPARHLTTVIVKNLTPNSCDKKPQRVETDGWYIDLPSSVTCATLPAKKSSAQVDPLHPDCVDDVRYELPETPVGFPVRYSTVATSGSEPPITTTMEVSEIVRTDLAAADFDVPSDYIEVRTVSQLTADHRPGEPGAKRPGVVRIGLAPLGNKTSSNLPSADLNDALLESFTDTDLDIVRLTGGSPEALEADARGKECDLILQSTVTELKVPRGGVLGKVSGSSGDAFTSRVDFALVTPGQAKPSYTGNERSGGSTLNSAINIAKKVAQFAPPVMMAKYGYMNAYGSMLNGNGSAGAMKQTPDPVMNMAFSFLDKASAKTAPEEFDTEVGAVASALEKEVKSVASEMSKKKK